jgi:hypothetical protein
LTVGKLMMRLWCRGGLLIALLRFDNLWLAKH